MEASRTARAPEASSSQTRTASCPSRPRMGRPFQAGRSPSRRTVARTWRGWITPNASFPRPPRDASHFLDLTGLNDTPLPDGSFGAVSQTFGTTVNKRYHLSFDIMVAPPPFGGPIPVDALIKRSPNEAPYAQTTCGPFNPTTPGNQAKTCGLDFTATTPSTTLTIVGTAAAHNYIGLDRVSVECVAPLGLQGFCS